MTIRLISFGMCFLAKKQVHVCMCMYVYIYTSDLDMQQNIQ